MCYALAWANVGLLRLNIEAIAMNTLNTLTYKQIRELGCDECDYYTEGAGRPTPCPECARDLFDAAREGAA